MKKIISLILAIGLMASFAACGKKDEDVTPTEDKAEVLEDTKKEEAEKETEEKEAETETEETVTEDNKDEVTEDVAGDAAEEEKPETEDETKEEPVGELTLGNTLLSFFNEKAKDGLNAEELANEIVQMGNLPFMPMVMSVEEGYLAGFDEEIKGFTSGVSFAPMIGSIPFVGYVFETEDADALIEALKKNANLRWNVCVEAEEMVVGKNGNKVFFVMCPKSLEE